MAHFIVEEDAIGLLSAQTLPEAVGGGANPYKDLVEWLDKTRGRWLYKNEVPAYFKAQMGYNKQTGIQMMKGLVARQTGTEVPDTLVYMSPFFNYDKIPLAVLPSAYGLMGAVGLYFELIDYEAFVTIPESAYDDAVPAYLPNASTQDEEGEPVATTWRNWKAANSTHRIVGTDNHIPLSSMTGAWLAGSIVVQLIAGGYTVGHFKDYPAEPDVEP